MALKLDKRTFIQIYWSILRREHLIFFILFIIFTFIMFIFYWYIITCFCAVYINTQSEFIKNSFSSFGLGLIYPFILYIFPAILRLISLRYCNGKLSPIYKTSDTIPFF